MFMFSVVDVIKERRSVRKYAPRKVARSVLREVLEAARWAPSAHNAQPWRFIALIDASVKQELAEVMANALKMNMTRDGAPANLCETKAAASVKRFTSAPVLVVACFTMKDMRAYADGARQECERDLAVQSLGAAVQNMLLAAQAKGLGACWFCAPIFCKKAVRNFLKLPADVEPQALITLGYPAEKPNAPRRKPLESFTYQDCWGNKI
jgi:coenzyme F420-0:L-glutamate ligase/coenzyme F420-1:gamma-L-glutamate ligase